MNKTLVSMNEFCVIADRFVGNSVPNTSDHLVLGIFANEVLERTNKWIHFCHKYIFIYQILRDNFKLKISISPGDGINSGGKQLSSGIWTGAIGLLVRNNADFFMTSFVYDINRSKFIDYPYLWYMKKQVSILSSPRTVRNDNLFSIITSFTKSVWLLVLSSYLTLWLINAKSTKTLISKLFLSLDYFAILLGKSIDLRLKHKRLLMSIWLLSTIIISTFFQSNIRSLLVSTRHHLIESLEQLMDEKDVSILLVKGSYRYNFVKENNKELLSKVKTIDFLDVYGQDLIAKVMSHRYVFVGDIKDVSNLKMHYYQYNLAETGDDIMPYFNGFAIRAHMNLDMKRKLSKMIVQIYRFGIFKYRLRQEVKFYKRLIKINPRLRHYDTNPGIEKSEQEAEQLLVSDLKFAFLSLIIGLIMAILVLIMEGFKRCSDKKDLARSDLYKMLPFIEQMYKL